MRILWVKVGGLWPLNTGGRLRSFHIVSELSRRHQLVLLTTRGPSDDPRGLSAALRDCAEVVSLPHRPPKRGSARFPLAVARSWLSPLPVDLWKTRVPALRAEVSRRLAAASADLCIADFLFAAPNVPFAGTVPVVLFAHNVEHLIWKRLRDTEEHFWRRSLLEVEWRKVRRYEVRVCRSARLTIAVSEADRALFGSIAPGAPLSAIPTGVDTVYFAPSGAPATPGRLVFTGSMDWFPNEDAVLYFVDTILPVIRREVPGATLTVAGRNPTARLRAAAERAGIELTGTVEDVRPYVAEAAAYVVPLRVGGGTRLKIFEALAMGKAVVSTSVGAEGLPLISGEHFLRADDPADFARAVVKLLRDRDLGRRLGLTGRRLVEARFSWAKVAREFDERCMEVVDRHARQGQAAQSSAPVS